MSRPTRTQDPSGSDRLASFHRWKAALVKRGEWMTVVDRDCTVRDCGLRIVAHSAPCEVCGAAPEHHGPGGMDDCWEGRARMALARHHAGVPLDVVDMVALLFKFPEPRSGVLREAA